MYFHIRRSIHCSNLTFIDPRNFFLKEDIKLSNIYFFQVLILLLEWYRIIERILPETFLVIFGNIHNFITISAISKQSKLNEHTDV